jgi:hypothetical protein
MNWNELIIDIFERISQMLERVLDGLTEDELNKQPRSDSNSIGWLVWHVTRVQDNVISGLLNMEPIWIREKWYDKFNRSSNPQDSGRGHSPEDVTSFRSPSSEILLGYHQTVLKQTKKYLTDLTIDDLNNKLDDPRFPTPPTIGIRMSIVVSDNLQHVGQAAYLRGILQGKGWLKF